MREVHPKADKVTPSVHESKGIYNDNFAPFISFMLRMILDAVTSTAPKSPSKSPPKSANCWRSYKEKWIARPCKQLWGFQIENPSDSGI